MPQIKNPPSRRVFCSTNGGTNKVALDNNRGLGTGGDPEIGYEAALESRDAIRSTVEGSNIVFLCAGLGGGTASGVIPVLAEAARESGAVVFSIVTSPFSFEGRRRSRQAADAMALLSKQSNALIHFENDRMAELSSPRSGIEETFAAFFLGITDQCLSGTVLPIFTFCMRIH